MTHANKDDFVLYTRCIAVIWRMIETDVQQNKYGGTQAKPRPNFTSLRTMQELGRVNLPELANVAGDEQEHARVRREIGDIDVLRHWMGKLVETVEAIDTKKQSGLIYPCTDPLTTLDPFGKRPSMGEREELLAMLAGRYPATSDPSRSTS